MPHADDFSHLSRTDLEAMQSAGQWVLECHRVLAVTSDNLVGEVLRDNGTFTELDHYPPGDVFDPNTNSQYYYHAHRENEHGHFHTFLRGEAATNIAAPISQSHMDYMDERDDNICHLIAISMDNAGLPIGLFTANRWVTAENWYKGKHVIQMLEKFEMDLAPPSWPLNIWISCMLRLFRPQIIDLIHARDKTIKAWRTDHPDTDVFEDRDIDITSEISISVNDQMQKIERALAKL